MTRKLDLRQYGVAAAGESKADQNTLLAILSQIADGTLMDTEDDHEDSATFEKRLATLNKSSANLANQLKAKESEKKAKEGERKDTKADEEATAKANFWITVVLLVVIALFLYIFYGSLTYSAFFKNYGAEIAEADTQDISDLFGALIDPMSFEKALESGFGSAATVILVPFVFLGLAWFLYQRKRAKDIKEKETKRETGGFKKFQLNIPLLLVIGLDIVMAYLTVKRIFDTSTMTGINTEKWTFWYPFTDLVFYAVILFGAGGYFLLNYLIHIAFDAYDKIDGKKDAQARRDALSKEIAKLQVEYTELESEKIHIDEDIKYLQSLLEKGDAIVLWSAIDRRINRFIEGWARFINLRDGENSPIARETMIAVGEFKKMKQQEFKKF